MWGVGCGVWGVGCGVCRTRTVCDGWAMAGLRSGKEKAYVPASKRRGNNLQSLKDFYLKAEASIWSRLSCMCPIHTTAGVWWFVVWGGLGGMFCVPGRIGCSDQNGLRRLGDGGIAEREREGVLHPRRDARPALRV